MNFAIANLAALGFIFGSATSAQIPHQTHDRTSEFRLIEQPIETKIAVTIGGLGIIGLELWWFLFSKPKVKSGD